MASFRLYRSHIRLSDPATQNLTLQGYRMNRPGTLTTATTRMGNLLWIEQLKIKWKIIMPQPKHTSSGDRNVPTKKTNRWLECTYQIRLIGIYTEIPKRILSERISKHLSTITSLRNANKIIVNGFHCWWYTIEISSGTLILNPLPLGRTYPWHPAPRSEGWFGTIYFSWIWINAASNWTLTNFQSKGMKKATVAVISDSLEASKHH